MKWRHPCLSWGASADSRKWGHIDSTWLKADQVWVPPLAHYNAMSDVGIFESNRRFTSVKVERDGSLIWKFIAKFDSFCELELKKFPFDSQTCSLSMRSNDPVNKVRFVSNNFKHILGDDFTSKIDVWETTDKQVRVSRVREGNFDEYDMVSFVVSYRRKSETYMLNLVLPTIIMLILLIGSIFMSPDDAGRSGFAMTVMLTLSVIIGTILSDIPDSSEVIYLTQYTTVLFFLAFIATVYTLVAIPLAKSSKFQQQLGAKGRLETVGISKMRAVDIIFYTALTFAFVLTNIILFALMRTPDADTM